MYLLTSFTCCLTNDIHVTYFSHWCLSQLSAVFIICHCSIVMCICTFPWGIQFSFVQIAFVAGFSEKIHGFKPTHWWECELYQHLK